MVASKPGLPSWISAAAVTKLDFEGKEDMLKEVASSSSSSSSSYSSKELADVDLGFGGRAFAAAGAAALSAVIVNPLDVAKGRIKKSQEVKYAPFFIKRSFKESIKEKCKEEYGWNCVI